MKNIAKFYEDNAIEINIFGLTLCLFGFIGVAVYVMVITTGVHP